MHLRMETMNLYMDQMFKTGNIHLSQTVVDLQEQEIPIGRSTDLLKLYMHGYMKMYVLQINVLNQLWVNYHNIHGGIELQLWIIPCIQVNCSVVMDLELFHQKDRYVV